MSVENNWDSSDELNLLDLYIGRDYSVYGGNSLDLIKKQKIIEAESIRNYLDLTKDDIVMDLGPGFGYIAEGIAPHVKRLLCVDISKSFLDKSKQELYAHKNVTFHHIKYGNFKMFRAVKVNAIYAMAVMIHFNVYDIYIYLKELYDCLDSSGKILFDFLEIEEFKLDNDEKIKFFRRHAEYYSQDRQRIVELVHYNHFDTIKQLAENIGYSVTKLRDGNHPLVLLKKQ